MIELKFLIDECLSPELARRLITRGFDATSVRDRGRLAKSDASILAYCIREDRVLVTQNAEDFRNLVGAVDVHPGIIILATNAKERSWTELVSALDHICVCGNPNARSWMFNHVVEVEGSVVTHYELPPVGRNE